MRVSLCVHSVFADVLGLVRRRLYSDLLLVVPSAKCMSYNITKDYALGGIYAITSLRGGGVRILRSEKKNLEPTAAA